MQIIRLLFLFSIVLTQHACVSVPATKTVENPDSIALNQQHLQDIAPIGQFTLQGRIGVQADGKGFSGSLVWQHGSDNDVITLYSPLGGQVASIKKSLDSVTLEDAKGNRISAADAETLTQTTLGWQLPLAGLVDWSLGRPSPSKIQSSSWDERGHLSTLKQDGWSIDYQNYTENNGYFLPGRISLKNEKVNLKLLVEKWGDLGN